VAEWKKAVVCKTIFYVFDSRQELFNNKNNIWGIFWTEDVPVEHQIVGGTPACPTKFKKIIIMERLKIRKTGSLSKRKIVAMINLYEQYVDERIISIDPNGYIKGDTNNYMVNIATNKVAKVYPDPE
jgi:hypothetical protein